MYIFSRVHATLYVTMSVGPSVRPSVGRSEITSLFSAFRAERSSDMSYCPCPTTILPLPTRTRLMLPCIRPCSRARMRGCFRQSIDDKMAERENQKVKKMTGKIDRLRWGRYMIMMRFKWISHNTVSFWYPCNTAIEWLLHLSKPVIGISIWADLMAIKRLLKSSCF